MGPRSRHAGPTVADRRSWRRLHDHVLGQYRAAQSTRTSDGGAAELGEDHDRDRPDGPRHPGGFYRLSKLSETLDKLGLEADRVQQIQIAHSDFDRLPQIIDDFVARIKEVGPNPFKEL